MACLEVDCGEYKIMASIGQTDQREGLIVAGWTVPL